MYFIVKIVLFELFALPVKYAFRGTLATNVLFLSDGFLHFFSLLDMQKNQFKVGSRQFLLWTFFLVTRVASMTFLSRH